MRIIKYAVINGGFMACLYMGLIEDVGGALNVALFWAWLSFAVSPFSVSDEAIGWMAEDNKFPSVPGWIDASVDVMVVVAFVWHGWIFTGMAFAVHAIIKSYARDRVKDIRGAKV